MQQLTGLIQSHEIYVENIFPQGHGFGVTTGGESVFFDPIFVRKHGVEEGSMETYVVVANAPDKRDRTPWRAVGVKPMTRSTSEPTSVQSPIKNRTPDDVDRLVLDVMGDTHENVQDDAWSCGELAYELELDSQTVSNSLHRLFAQGKLVKNITHQRPGLSSRGSFIRWSIDVGAFFPPSKEVLELEKSIAEDG